jgi:YebC/PmpR family DNA-binding regulatory protein
MSGHSKWATIKRKKAATDAKRGKVFTRLLREIQVAAKLGGPVEGNARLRTAVQAARSVSVPSDNIDRAIKRGLGQLDGADYEEVVYEAYGPGGVGILVKTLTDNRNRTVGELRSILSRHGGSMAGANAVAYLFAERGSIAVPKDKIAEDDLMALALEAGADDLVDEGDRWVVQTDLKSFEPVRSAVQSRIEEAEASLAPVASTSIPVTGKDAETLLKLLEALDDLDDVQNVYANFDIDESELSRLSA